MDFALDPTSTRRIQREIEKGHYQEPAQVVARALELLDLHESWLEENRQSIHQRIEESFTQVARGEGIDEDRARQMLALKKANRD